MSFNACSSLLAVYFKGDAPSVDYWAFYNANNATIYYLPGKAVWPSTFAQRPTAPWNLQLQPSSAAFCLQTNAFGFTVTGLTNTPIAVETCTNLAHPTWLPLQDGILTNGAFYFSDRAWTNSPLRLYRVMPGPIPLQ